MPNPEKNFDHVAEMRTEQKGIFGLPKPLHNPGLSFDELASQRATNEGMPEPIIMRPGVVIKLP